MARFEDEVLYGISIDGNQPGVWDENYPSQKEIDFYSAPQYKSIEVIEKDVTYENVAKIR